MGTLCSPSPLQSIPLSIQRDDLSCKPDALQQRQGIASTAGRADASTGSAAAVSAQVLPTFDLSEFLEADAGSREALQRFCRDMADCLAQTGCLIVRDPRVGTAEADCFLDMMERYFGQPADIKMPDVHPELHYQVGATPEGVEVPRCVVDPACLETIEQQLPGHKATVPTGADPKWRFFWRLGPRPAQTKFAELNAEPVIPQGFPEWREVMDDWGTKMLATVSTVAEVVACGLGLPADAFTSRMHMGPHLLAPTGTDLGTYGALGSCYAGYHYDLNFLTIHGKSRFPGLAVWLQDGRRMPVSIPSGCLLIQAGKQIEWLTNGHVRAGMHEVVCTEATRVAVERMAAEGRQLWRVSSTVFAHMASDVLLEPLGRFAQHAGENKYKPILAGDFVQEELEAIRLKGTAPC
ncbi:Clavaminate synthase-like protein [Coccomyxa subellipsoidea C-169]|uniref:Clavaminate synthase-like protein n=1 Tax=Coccomyxa subellipsoidea (strain C-169) TaxID=574566 RepID=I0Z490_COCSC|nr:Clavaminate synthase-like protein [Coccomyxa subellipsoidea C-169]EIE25459.1 Clavaminate synthase-like protein [Coccomyxa subellipsoidea C-169]|eukprot:XP_005650003.1 Clavaminate synthase-like protein [Coccomyxa subellipsoidea C-169]